MQAAKAMARGWKKSRPGDALTLLPISDGGDGFGSLLAKLLKAQRKRVASPDPSFGDSDYNWWLSTTTKTAIVESAEIIGLAKLKQHTKLNPMRLDTRGVGHALNRIESTMKRQQQPPLHVIIGIGGSATNDGGFGLARELGWRFKDKSGNEIERWPDLRSLEQIIRPNSKNNTITGLKDVTVAVDVQNPLLGSDGCSQVYGPQKGLKKADLPRAEAALGRLAEVWETQSGVDAANFPGAGAAGGLGFGLHCFASAKIRSGFEIYAEAAELPQILKNMDMVITGEGAMDRQTVMGKGVGELAKLASKKNCSCIGLAGQLADAAKLRQLFSQCGSLTQLTPAKNALAKPGYWLAKLAEKTAANLQLT